MGFSRDEGKDFKVTKARSMRGECERCYKMIMPDEYYVKTCGSITRNCGIAHYNCDKPSGAPAWEELSKEAQAVLRG